MGHVVQRGDQVVRSCYLLILMFLQGTIRLIVEPLDEPYEHICNIVECPTRCFRVTEQKTV